MPANETSADLVQFFHAGALHEGRLMQDTKGCRTDIEGLLMVEFRNAHGVPRYGTLLVNICGTYTPCCTLGCVEKAKRTLGHVLTLENGQAIRW